MFVNVSLVLFLVTSGIIFVYSFDPNAVSHTTKSELVKMIKDGSEDVLVYFCKCLINYYLLFALLFQICAV